VHFCNNDVNRADDAGMRGQDAKTSLLLPAAYPETLVQYGNQRSGAFLANFWDKACSDAAKKKCTDHRTLRRRPELNLRTKSLRALCSSSVKSEFFKNGNLRWMH
jgi:hypothetical protein